MKTTITANALLLALFALLFTEPLLGAAYLATILYMSKKHRKFGMLWVRYYRQVLTWENILLKH